jgi:hypothetical protein
MSKVRQIQPQPMWRKVVYEQPKVRSFGGILFRSKELKSLFNRRSWTLGRMFPDSTFQRR